MTPLEQPNDLPLAVRKRQDYFPQLLDRLADGPLWDTHETLNEALAAYKATEKDLFQGRKFIARLEHYLAKTPMKAEHRKRIEDWALWATHKERKFLNDLMMPEWKEVVTESDRPTLEHRLEVFSTTGRRIDQLDKDLDKDGINAANTERHIAQIEKRLAELNAARSLINLAPPLDTAHQLADKSMAAIAHLCLQPFTPDDLTALLQYLSLLNAQGNNLTASLKGKKRSVWGKFTAAYRVLQRHGLLEATANDAEWAGAFKTAYKATLGPDVRSHNLTAQGHGRSDTPDEFKKGVEDATFWVKGWLNWRGAGIERPVKPFNAL